MPEVTPGSGPYGPDEPTLSREIVPWRPTPHGAPYPVSTDLVPVSPAPWEAVGPGDEGRLPGTRRLWLAGGLAVAVTIAVVAVMSVQANRSDDPSRNLADNRTTADTSNPFLLGAPAGTTTAPAGKNALASPGTSRSASPDSASADSASRGSVSPGPSDQGSGSRPVPGNSTPAASGTASAPRQASSWKSVQSVNYPDRFWHLSDGQVRLDPVGSGSSAATRRAASFKVVRGLAKSSCYSFATADGSYLRHRDFLLRADRDDGSALFRKDATFCPRASSYSGAVMLEAVNYPGRFLRHRNFQLRLGRHERGRLYRADSAFRLVRGWA
ncbi:AbfB domain-containing protein [Streptomyces sp. NPDC054766]|uniref:AbfB domain-containing protein n=1 Tax=Streptomyces rhizosphaerihabitans TaxID=1266770 RepID=UPI0021BFCECD|nr:AbfB domain-containing protein [Streptomyces rhizosphaerihabitans]MCT9004939.1 AbfB domain-containing protein [Streptomyces rhizosphaerihabitans]